MGHKEADLLRRELYGNGSRFKFNLAEILGYGNDH
jgi:hypothetical protein